MSDLEQGEKFERSLSGLTRSVLDTAISEMNMSDICTGEETASQEERDEIFRKLRQKEYTQLVKDAEHEREMLELKLVTTDEDDMANGEERLAYFRAVRQAEYDKLMGAVGREKAEGGNTTAQLNCEEDATTEEERLTFFRAVRQAEYDKLMTAVGREETELKNATEQVPNGDETASEEERIAYFRSIRQTEHDKLLDAVNRQRSNVDSYEADKTKDVNEEQVEGQAQPTEEETAGEKERLAFFQSVRDSEYKKLVEAVEKDQIRKEQQKKKAKKTIVTDKQCDEFFNVDDSSVIYRKPTSQHDNYNQPSTSTNETNSIFHKTSPNRGSSVSDILAHGTENSKDNKEIDSTKDMSTHTENKKPFDRSFSEVGIKRQHSINGLILKLFKRSKSMSNFQKDPEMQTCEQKTTVQEEEIFEKLKIPDLDVDDFEEPPKPRLKPFFISNEEETQMNLSVHVEDTQEERSTGNVFTRAGKRIRGWLKGLSCCCCKPDIVDNLC